MMGPLGGHDVFLASIYPRVNLDQTKKKLEAFGTSNKNLATLKLFSIEGAPQFTVPLKRLWANIFFLSPI